MLRKKYYTGEQIHEAIDGVVGDYKKAIEIYRRLAKMETDNVQPEKPRKPKKWIKQMKIIKNEKFEVLTPKWYCPSCGKEYDPALTQVVGLKFCYECGERVEE